MAGIGLWKLRLIAEGLTKEGPKHGYYNALTKHIGLVEMVQAAGRLPVAARAQTGPAQQFHFMTGHSHYFQTVFAAYSLVQSSSVNIQPIVHDDGSLTDAIRENMRRIVPAIVFTDAGEMENRLNELLPVVRFPRLREIRQNFVLMRKLTDVHAYRPGVNVFLDSDMLFYREPRWLLEWKRNPGGAYCMRDYMNSYGYSEALLTSVLGKPMPMFVNTGICGLESSRVDWDQLESWLARLLAAEGLNHFTEQALTAMWMGAAGYAEAPPEDYVIYPSVEETKNPAAVMHHYVAESRAQYYRFGWRHFANGWKPLPARASAAG